MLPTPTIISPIASQLAVRIAPISVDHRPRMAGGTTNHARALAVALVGLDSGASQLCLTCSCRHRVG